jgi:hypothetical protein
MTDSLLPLIVLLAAVWIWQNALRARERARMLARELCARAGVQLLDQTVSLRRMRLHRVPGSGLRVLRCYGFEISVDGADRRHGSLDLLEGEVVSWDLPVMPATDEPVAGNVIELRPPQTLH